MKNFLFEICWYIKLPLRFKEFRTTKEVKLKSSQRAVTQINPYPVIAKQMADFSSVPHTRNT